MLLRRLWGGVMMVTAVVGLIVNLFLIFKVWDLRQPVTDGAEAGLDLFNATLNTTSDALITLQQSLDATSAQIDALDQMSQTMAKSLHDTAPLVDSLKTLTGKDLPSTLQATSKSLDSAKTSAKLVDDVLGSLTQMPFLAVAPYQPEVPLNSALGQVSASLNSLNAPLAAINSSLSTTSGNLATIEAQTRELSQNVQKVKQNLADIRGAVVQYEQTVIALHARVNQVKQLTPNLVTLGAVLLSFILAWLMITQIDLLIRGYTILTGRALWKRPLTRAEQKSNF